MSKRFKIIWFFIALLFGYSLNEINLYFVKKANPENVQSNEKSTMYGYTIYNVDHEWYLPEIKFMLAGEGFTLDPKNPELKVRRTPVYPLFYGLHYILFGEENSFMIIRHTQLLLNALAVILLGLAIFNFTKNILWSKIAVYAYAFCPFVWIYSYHTITESLTPFLIIISIYYFSCYWGSQKKKYLFISGIMIGIAMLNRPITCVLFPAFLLAFVDRSSFTKMGLKFLFNRSFLVGIGLFITILPWEIRNYIVTKGEIVFLEKYYYEDSMDFGKSHMYFRNWLTCWSNTQSLPITAEMYSNTIRNNYKNGITANDSTTKQFLNSCPDYAFTGNSYASVYSAMIELNNCFRFKDSLKKLDPNISRKEISNLKCEEDVKSTFVTLINNFKKASPLRYYLITPLKISQAGIIQSNSMAFGSLNPVNKDFNFFQLVIKSMMYALNISLFALAFAFLLFAKGQNGLRWMVAGFILITLFSLIFIFYRFIDARYLLPTYPFLYISFSYFIARIFQKKNT